MKKVYKYELNISDYIKIKMPVGSKILSVQTQRETPCLWAMVEPGNEVETRLFRVAGTGHPIKEPEYLLNFIGTIQMADGALIFHIFEIIG